MKFLLNFLAGVLIILAGVEARAQVSVEAGAGYVWQSGSFLAPCGCTFAFGSGFGVLADVSFNVAKTSDFTFGLRAGVEYQQLMAHEVTAENTNARIANGDQESIKLAYLNLDPYIRYLVPNTAIVLQASPGFGYVMSRAFHHITGSSSSGDEVVLNPDSAVDIHSLRCTAKLSAGYVISLSGMTLTPMITYVLPLNALSTSPTGDKWKISAIYATLALRF